jgi:branched-chain amino acid transport system substrate-binding protein
VRLIERLNRSPADRCQSCLCKFPRLTPRTARFEPVEAGNGIRPDHIGVAVYDALHLVYAAINKTGGNTNGDALIAAMKGMAWESPRGPVSIDPETREMIQDVYIRRVERVDGELYNVEFEKFAAVKVPDKTKQAR